MLHDGHKAFLGEHIILQLDVEGPPVLGVPGGQLAVVQVDLLLTSSGS